MGVFHANISEINNDAVWHLVLTFPDSASADEWGRAVLPGKTAAGAPANPLSDIRRINPQFYNHNASIFNVYEFFTDWRVTELAKPFRGRMFITTAVGGGTTLSLRRESDRPRSTSAPRLIRVCTGTTKWVTAGRVVVSNCQRTMFSVGAKNVPEKTDMIRSDTVALSAWPHNRVIRITSQGNLIGDDWTFDFEDFATGRFVDSDGVVVYGNIADNAPKKPG
ncbi:hypothetical protein BDN71DRAFT_1588870 [Pleurotus eryngii]|uniref:Uncharacterized protein n=1 Tax=Pleurotus eryngii TaxID=5323 RepID=A0A9P5ZYN4_PLEER|nr:hypothetical protein BDN71DRAFT_1588870 [Pleurotus eryngii]